MNSAIYKGLVEHYRIKPTRHGFRYPVIGFGFFLDELEQLDKDVVLFGYNKLRPISIHDKDYLEPGPGSIQQKLLRLLTANGIDVPVERVFLVTSARYFNYIFNPVSFYYCFDNSETIVAMVAEVNNTFGERHIYIPEKTNSDLDSEDQNRYVAKKAFHVSPFNDLEGQYEFFFPDPRQHLDVKINLIKAQQPFFKARLHGLMSPLNSRNLLKTLLKHPTLPHLTMPRILYEAAKLFFLRKMSYIEKPDPVSPMTVIQRPKVKK